MKVLNLFYCSFFWNGKTDFRQLRVRKAEPVERSKTRISIVQAVTSHIRFRNQKIEKWEIWEASSFKKRLRFRRQFFSFIFSSSHGNLSFEKRGFFRKKIEFLFFFSKNNHFGKKLSTESQSLFERASLPYFLCFNFPISQSDVWRYRLDNAYTRFRALDRFCFPNPQFSENELIWDMTRLNQSRHENLKNYISFIRLVKIFISHNIMPNITPACITMRYYFIK